MVRIFFREFDGFCSNKQLVSHTINKVFTARHDWLIEDKLGADKGILKKLIKDGK